jgi:protein required for attachment to host cells
MTTWILVANRAEGRLYQRTRRNMEAALIETIDHPEGRLRDGQVFSDHLGVTTNRASHSRRPYGPDELPHERIAFVFAHRLAARLRKGRIEGNYQRLLLVSDPRFLGLLRAALDPPTLALVVLAVDKDLVPLTEPKRRDHIRQMLAAVSGYSAARG